MKLDEVFPKFDFSEKHSRLLHCTPLEAYNALRTVNFSDSIWIRFLFWLRGLKSGDFQHLQERFSVLSDEPGQEIVLGIIARPWKRDGDIFYPSSADFESFNQPDYIKAAWNFTFEQLNENETLVSTETRILCTDAKSKQKFRLYWFFIHPFSGFVRIEMLKLLQKKLED